MTIFERVIRALIYLCVLALCFFLIVYVLAAIGFPLPHPVLLILRVIFILIGLLVLVRLFIGTAWPPNWRFFP